MLSRLGSLIHVTRLDVLVDENFYLEEFMSQMPHRAGAQHHYDGWIEVFLIFCFLVLSVSDLASTCFSPGISIAWKL